VIEQLLADRVIRPQQAMAVGYADTQPLVNEDSEQAYALNRRVEIIIEPNKAE